MVKDPNWRFLRSMRNAEGRKKFREIDPPRLDKDISKQIKGAKDARGGRRGSDEN